MFSNKTIRFLMLLILIAAYVILALCDFYNGRYRTGGVSMLFAVVTWLVFF